MTVKLNDLLRVSIHFISKKRHKKNGSLNGRPVNRGFITVFIEIQITKNKINQLKKIIIKTNKNN